MNTSRLQYLFAEKLVSRRSLLCEFELRISSYFVPFNLYALLAIVPLIHLSPPPPVSSYGRDTSSTSCTPLSEQNVQCICTPYTDNFPVSPPFFSFIFSTFSSFVFPTEWQLSPVPNSSCGYLYIIIHTENSYMYLAQN
jgi:hypothetical protein